MARISKLANPEFAQSVAEAYINGCSRAEMADMFGAHKDTITDWVRDPRVQGHAARFAQERVNRITRKVDASIERELENVDEIPMELKLKIRKEFLERAVKIDLGQGADSAETIEEAMKSIEDNPALAGMLQELAKGPK